MWPFKKKQPKPSVSDNSRYQANPSYVFFENYVLDVLGKLPPEKSASIQAMNLQKIFSARASEWREVLREVLHLSETIDIAILDLWVRNRACHGETDQDYFAYAQNFVDHYTARDSKVDVWPDGTLEAAKERIRQYQSNGA